MMRTLTMRWRWAAMAGAGVCVAAGAAGVALAASGGSAATYTGCLSTQGAISLVQKGTKPIGNACPTGKTAIKLSSGDITGVTAGTGLAGGATSGNATLGLTPAYSLPQSCAAGEHPDATGGNSWTCSPNPDSAFSFDAIAANQTAAVDSGFLELGLTCNTTSHTGNLEVFNLSSVSATFNMFYGVFNTGTSADTGFSVNPGAQQTGPNTAGSTGTLVYSDGDGGIVTGTISWFYDAGSNTCQFHGALSYDLTS